MRSPGYAARSPSAYPPAFHHQSPSIHSPLISTPTPTHQHLNDAHHPSPPGGPNFSTSHGPILHPPRAARASLPNVYGSVPGPSSESGSVTAPSYNNGFNHSQSNPNYSHQQPPVLPPFSAIQSQTMGPPGSQPPSALRYPHELNALRSGSRHHSAGHKRQAAAPSNVTSADSSDIEDDDNGELPPGGLVAPWKVLQGLADVAVERASKVPRAFKLILMLLTPVAI